MNQALLEQARSLSRTDLGAWGERCADMYVRTLGYKVLARNWRGRGGELDIVAFDPKRDAVVAIEVKTRRASVKSGVFRSGTPEEAVTAVKIQRIYSLLVQWVKETEVQAHQLTADVIGVSMRGEEYTIRHVKDVQK